MKTSVVIDDITHAASSVGLDITDTEKCEIRDHLAKQVLSFAAISDINTDGITVSAPEGGNV